MFYVNISSRDELLHQLCCHLFNAIGYAFLNDERVPLQHAPNDIPGVKRSGKAGIVSLDISRIERLQSRGTAVSLHKAQELQSKLRREAWESPISEDRVVEGSRRYWVVYLPPIGFHWGNKNNATLVYEPRKFVADLFLLSQHNFVRAWMHDDKNREGNFYCLFDFFHRLGYENGRRSNLERSIAELLFDAFNPEFVFVHVYNNPNMLLRSKRKEESEL